MPECSWDIQHKQFLSHTCKQCYISVLVQPGKSPGIEMCLSAPKLCNINNILSCTFKQCCISFLVQSGRSPGIQMCLSVLLGYTRQTIF